MMTAGVWGVRGSRSAVLPCWGAAGDHPAASAGRCVPVDPAASGQHPASVQRPRSLATPPSLTAPGQTQPRTPPTHPPCLVATSALLGGLRAPAPCCVQPCAGRL